MCIRDRGITTDAPRVLQQDEIDALLPLVDDSGLLLESGTARLQRPGQAVDLGGIDVYKRQVRGARTILIKVRNGIWKSMYGTSRSLRC